jgi:hypothetical protein
LLLYRQSWLQQPEQCTLLGALCSISLSCASGDRCGRSSIPSVIQRNEDTIYSCSSFIDGDSPVITNFDCSHLMLRKCAMGAEMCLKFVMTTASVMWATWCHPQAMDTQLLFLAALRSFSRKKQKNNEMGMWTVGDERRKRQGCIVAYGVG